MSEGSGSALVLTSRQLLVSQLAVVMCSAVMELGLGDWEDYRIALGAEQDELARRLRAAQMLEEDAAVELVECLDACGRPVVAVAVELSDDDIWVLQVALERLRGSWRAPGSSRVHSMTTWMRSSGRCWTCRWPLRAARG